MNLRVAIFDVLYVIRIYNLNPSLMQFLSHRNITYHVPVIELQKVYRRKKKSHYTMNIRGWLFFIHFFFWKICVYKANEDFTLSKSQYYFLEWDQINTFDLWYDKQQTTKKILYFNFKLFCMIFGIEFFKCYMQTTKKKN